MTDASRHLTILTGASRGLGRAMAEQLLQRAGDSLLCISRSSQPALADAASAAGSEGAQWEMDLADAAPVAERLRGWLAAQDAQRWSRVTLINNAGTVGSPTALADADFGALAQAMRIGLEAPMLLAAAFLGATRDWQARRA